MSDHSGLVQTEEVIVRTIIPFKVSSSKPVSTSDTEQPVCLDSPIELDLTQWSRDLIGRCSQSLPVSHRDLVNMDSATNTQSKPLSPSAAAASSVRSLARRRVLNLRNVENEEKNVS